MALDVRWPTWFDARLSYPAWVIVICGDFGSIDREESLANSIAQRTAAAGAAVEIVGIVPDGAEGDRWLIALSATGVGHAAVLRTADRPLERADLELALRYLPDVRVVVAVGMSAAVLPVIAEGASYAGASVVVVATEASGGPIDEGVLPASAIVLQAPPTDPDDTFAGFVGAFTARLDAGAAPAEAWLATVSALAVDTVSRDADRGPSPPR